MARICVLQHVPYEGPAHIESWARERGHELFGVRLDRGEGLPSIESFELLVIMGGPMSCHAPGGHLWLAGERNFIADAIRRDRVVLGICLGAQLIAQALGARVYAAPAPEIGWFPVRLTPAAAALPLFAHFPDEFMALHWHGDSFDLPPGSVPLGASACTPHQGFLYNEGRVVALQFHLEATEESTRALAANCADQLGQPGESVQDERTLLDKTSQEAPRAQALLESLLDKLPLSDPA